MIRGSTLFGLLLTVFLISLYTAVPVSVSIGTSSLLVPSALILLVLVPLLLVTLSLKGCDLAFLTTMFGVLLLTALLSPGFDLVGQKLLGLAQTTTSLVAGVLLLRLLDRVGQRKAAIALFVLSLILVLGSFLEVAGVLRAASDSFREAAYNSSPYFVYDDPLRDASITGFERASFFASEPSVLAKGFLAFVNAWLLLYCSKKNFLIAMSLTAALFVLTGSPVLIVSAMISVGIAATGEREVGALSVIAAILGLAGLILLLNSDVVYSLIQRFQYVYSLGSNSILLARDSIGLRLVLPALTLVAVWRSSPLFGVGISGKEVAASYTNFYIPTTAIDYGSNIGFANNFMAVLMYFGLVGTVMFMVALVWYFRRLGIKSILLLLFILVAFSFTGGGFEEARTWGYVFLFVWAVKIRDRSRDLAVQEERPLLPTVEESRSYGPVGSRLRSNYPTTSSANDAT